MHVTREQALHEAGRVVAASIAITAQLTPREIAEQAWRPGGPSVDDLAAQFEAQGDTADG